MPKPLQQRNWRPLIAGILFIVLIVSAVLCGRSRFDPIPGLSDTPVDVQESYYLEQIHRDWAKDVGGVVSWWWSECGAVTEVDSSKWPEHKVITIKASNHPTTIQITDMGYDPSLTRISYGTPNVVTTPETLPSHDYIYDLADVDKDGEFRQTDEVTLDRSRSVTVKQGVEFDVTAEAEEKVSGTYAGVGIEATLKQSFGYKNSEEEERAEAESKSVTRSHEFKQDLPAGKVTRIAINAGSSTSETKMSIAGVATWNAMLTLGEPCTDYPHWWNTVGRWVIHPDNELIWDCWGQYPYPNQDNKNGRYSSGAAVAEIHDWLAKILGHPCPVPVSVDTLYAMFNGEVAEWQGMSGRVHPSGKSWLDRQPAVVRDHLDAAQRPSDRSIRISGRQSLAYVDDLITSVTYITEDMIDDIINQGGVLCKPDLSTC